MATNLTFWSQFPYWQVRFCFWPCRHVWLRLLYRIRQRWQPSLCYHHRCHYCHHDKMSSTKGSMINDHMVGSAKTSDSTRIHAINNMYSVCYYNQYLCVKYIQTLWGQSKVIWYIGSSLDRCAWKWAEKIRLINSSNYDIDIGILDSHLTVRSYTLG